MGTQMCKHTNDVFLTLFHIIKDSEFTKALPKEMSFCCLLVFLVLGLEPESLHALGKPSTATELYHIFCSSQPPFAL